ncbi:O-methyltransferase [Phytoactinopolyspora alkaliphila]|uniref:O-methyltransferase n=1 Tax=Phytoactinopolyspora alkaliphila TaxID=1783498 RepID=A0A6N9YUE8_9ACTN|nr:O-methyltransferase [Phytoactinopolyspora alkaliphila]NED98429.1 O-methyltransferase [Phytoactinopolyspora alkaliphila]
MNQATQWDDVDRYVAQRLQLSDDVLESTLRASDDAGLPAINVAPNQGKMLQLFAQMQGARNILELGTLGGYSTIWLARALPPEGRLVTLEYDERNAEVARQNLARAGFAAMVDVRVGPALRTLPELADENAGPFDLVFIDANKEDTPEYFAWALRLSQVGSVIIVDNVVRAGALADESSTSPQVQGMRRFLDDLAQEERVDATVVQTVGSKGYDGFALAVVVAAGMIGDCREAPATSRS